MTHRAIPTYSLSRTARTPARTSPAPDAPTLAHYLADHNRGVLLARLASGEVDCEVTVYTNSTHGHEYPCGRPPFAPGARVCVKHEADRVRLGGAS